MTDSLPYRNPLVRDLAWALSSPPLLQRHDTHVYWPDRDWFEQITAQFREHLRRLDIHPEPLIEIVDNQKDRRLGNYFETLWRFWLNNDERYRLLHANLPLRTAERTLGEFDFLVKDTQSGKTLHWEIAVKFYLGSDDTRQPCNWWGPARRDRLDIKTQRLLRHQGRLSQRPEAKKLFRSLELQVDESWLILKGRLFYPCANNGAPPLGSHPDHLQGFWLRRQSLTELKGAWLPLERQQWLASVADVAAQRAMTGAALSERWTRQPLKFPVCLARISAGREAERGFVVPDDWG